MSIKIIKDSMIGLLVDLLFLVNYSNSSHLKIISIGVTTIPVHTVTVYKFTFTSTEKWEPWVSEGEGIV